jgi:hypothetical protein
MREDPPLSSFVLKNLFAKAPVNNILPIYGSFREFREGFGAAIFWLDDTSLMD